VTNFVPTATPDLDYFSGEAAGTMVFDDFQMSSNLSFTIFPASEHHVNRVLIGALFNPRLDPRESGTITPPTALTGLTNTIVNILDQVVSGPDPHVQSPLPPFPFIPVDVLALGRPGNQTALGFPGTNVFNFTTATIACTEDVSKTGVAQIRVHRSTVQGPPTGSSVNYRIDWYDHNGANVPNANNTFRSSGPSHFVPFGAEIPLQPGSDYATPENPNYFSQQWGFLTVDPVLGPIWNPGMPDFVDTPAFPLTGTLTWGANDGADKIISITISNDARVEFNEDLLVQLYFDPLDPFNPPAETDRTLGFIQNCALTILFDDQPAGAVDRTHNPDNNADTDPPYNQHPGANATVFTTAVKGTAKRSSAAASMPITRLLEIASPAPTSTGRMILLSVLPAGLMISSVRLYWIRQAKFWWAGHSRRSTAFSAMAYVVSTAMGHWTGVSIQD